MNSSKAKCFACGKEFKVKNRKQDLYCPDCQERETAKDNLKMKRTLENDDEPLFRFTVGFMQCAADDYINAILKWHKAYTAESKQRAFDEIRYFSKWFKSDNFYYFALGLDGNKLQTDLNKKAFEQIREKRLKSEHKKERRYNGKQ